MVKQLTVIRKDLLILNNALNELEVSSRPISTAITKCEEATMWTGTMIGVLNQDTPYKNNGSRKDVKDIEARYDDTLVSMSFPSHIEAVDGIRESLETLHGRVISLMNENTPVFDDDKQEMMAMMAMFNICTRIKETRMWLGMELNRIRKESGKTAS